MNAFAGHLLLPEAPSRGSFPRPASARHSPPHHENAPVSEPAGLTDLGLPPGLADRVTVRTYGALEVHLPAREDLVCFKLYAAVDQGERSKHFRDLGALAPTPEQLLNAARWTRTHDPSPGFLDELRRILGLLGVEVSDADL